MSVSSANGQRPAINARRIAAFIALFAIVALRIEPQLLRLPFIDRTKFDRELAEMADGQWWQYPRFLEGVREHTKPGEKIAIMVPPNKWDEGYSYAYYRGSYFLSGREVLPVITEDDRVHLENLRGADAIAAWHMRGRPRGARVVWEGEGGLLLQH